MKRYRKRVTSRSGIVYDYHLVRHPECRRRTLIEPCVPPTELRARIDARDAEIADHAAHGVPYRTLGRDYGISAARVGQIVMRERRRLEEVR